MNQQVGRYLQFRTVFPVLDQGYVVVVVVCGIHCMW